MDTTTKKCQLITISSKKNSENVKNIISSEKEFFLKKIEQNGKNGKFTLEAHYALSYIEKWMNENEYENIVICCGYDDNHNFIFETIQKQDVNEYYSCDDHFHV